MESVRSWEYFEEFTKRAVTEYRGKRQDRYYSIYFYAFLQDFVLFSRKVNHKLEERRMASFRCPWLYLHCKYYCCVVHFSDVQEVSSYNFEDRILQFFIDVVTEFCFSASKDAFSRIDDEVIVKIIGYAFHSKNNTTKSFSPFEEYAVDVSPVIRSFIVQQLLKRFRLPELFST